MKNYLKSYRVRLTLLFGLLLMANKPGADAQQEPLPNYNIEQEFARAVDFMNAYKNDSANIILVELIEALEQLDQLNTPLGLKIRMRHAEALEKDNQDMEAMGKLLEVISASEENEQWAALSNAYLSLARLYEKIDRPESCLSNLWLAKKTINTHNIDSLYPRFAVRYSSYHRVFNDLDSARFYAEEVLRTAPLYQQAEHEAVGHLLLGITLTSIDYKKSIQHYKAAGHYWKRVGDYNGYAAIMANLAWLYHRNYEPELALLYNDSALIVAKQAYEMGSEQQAYFYYSYKKRAEIYETLGELDSALYYWKKGYEIEVEVEKRSNADKIIEIDALHQNEQKGRKIAKQEQQIRHERERILWLWGGLAIIVFFALALAYYYFRLRKVNKALSHSLQKQLVLQSEVHHRVKNNLQVIISLLELQMEEIKEPDIRKTFESMSNRIYSMAAIHEILYQQEDTVRLRLADYIENLCVHFSNFSLPENKPIFQLEIGEFYFNLETSMPLGIILTELLTNSLKYGRIAGKTLQIDIKLSREKDGFCFYYKDNGPGFPNGKLEEREGGLGSYLLRSMVRQLNGNFENTNEDGARYKIYFKEKLTPLL